MIQIKFCPILECEEYPIIKNENEKEVKCKIGHNFNYLRNWHGISDCELELEKEFQIWKMEK